MIIYPSGYSNKNAVYLPSIQSTFLVQLKKQFSDLRDGEVPAHIPNMEALNFWSGKGLFYWPNMLYSPGSKKFGKTWKSQLATHQKTHSPMADRDRSTSFCMVDSGGFQIVTDHKFNFVDYNNLTKLNEHRLGLLRWQEAYGDMALTFEAPTLTALIHGKNHPRLKTDQDCLDFTIESMTFAQQHQEQKVKWIAPIQGVDFKTQKKWYNAVKQFKPYGFAFACSQSAGKKAPFRNAYTLLRMLRYMIDDGAFTYCRHVHLLGMTGPMLALTATVIKFCLHYAGSDEETSSVVENDIEVTFDSASYSVAMSVGNMYPGSEHDKNVISRLKTLHVPQDEIDKKSGKLIKNYSDEWADKDQQIPGDMRSPVLKGLKYSDLVGWTKTPYKKTGLQNRIWDPVANSIMINQNVWQEIEQLKDSFKWYAKVRDFNDIISRTYKPHNLGEVESNYYEDALNWKFDEKLFDENQRKVGFLGELITDLGKEMRDTGEIPHWLAESAVINLVQNGVLPETALPHGTSTFDDAYRLDKLVRQMLSSKQKISKADQTFLENVF